MAKEIRRETFKRFTLKGVLLAPALLSFWFLILFNLKTFGEGLVFCFEGPMEGQRLETDVIKYIHAQSGVECIYYCMLQDESCRAVNFRKTSSEGKENCELLRAVASEIPGLLHKDEHFDYYILLQPNRKSRIPAPSSTLPQITQKVSTTIKYTPSTTVSTMQPTTTECSTTQLTCTSEHLTSSCKELLERNHSLLNGVYDLQANASTYTYPVYCHMTEIFGCGAGGWTLVMKTDGDASTFTYDSSYWTNKESYAVEDGLEGLTEKESKLASYWNTPFKKICLGMIVNSDTKWIVLNYEASSLYSVIADGQYRSTSAGRYTWKSLIAGSSLQPNCNKEGFSIAYNTFKIRIGFYTNNQQSCSYADSGIGFGISYKACYITSHITCGNIAQCSDVDNGHKLTAAFGYIFVQ